MKTLFLILVAGLFAAMPAQAACGDEGLECGADERCCENVVALFSGDSPMAPSYVEGRCIPRGQKCNQFWCGNRQCTGGLFGKPTVCCVQQHEGQAPRYACAYDELSCPGNTTQLTIRDTQPERKLQGI